MGMNSDLLLNHFVGRDDVIAKQYPGGNFKPYVETPPSQTVFDSDHRAGKVCYGFYPMRADNTVMLACVDIDNHENDPNPEWRKEVEKLYYYLVEQNFPVYVEHSANSGAHLWIFFNQPVEAYKPRAFFRLIAGQLDMSLNEVFPKQERLRGKGYGNLIRYPFWNKSHFVDVENEWAEVDVESIQTIDPDEMQDFAAKLHTRLEPATPVQIDGDLPSAIATFVRLNPHDRLAQRWHGSKEGLEDRSMSSLVQSMAVLAVKRHFTTFDIEQMIRVWCYENNYEKGSRDDWVLATVRKAYEFAQEKPVSHHATSTIHDCSNFYLDKLGTQSYFSTGVASLDLAGMRIAGGEMWVYGARPGMGKTALGLQLLYHNSKQGIPTLFLSAEMGEYEIGRRNVQTIAGGSESEWIEDKDAVRRKLEAYYNAENVIPTQFRIVGSIEECEEATISAIKRHGVKLVCVDYIQLLTGSGGNLYEQTTNTSKRLKGLCRDYGVAMLALSQLVRDVDKREKLEMSMSDLANSGGIERDACGVATGYWWAKSSDPDADRSAYDVFLLKRRNGPVNQTKVRIEFDGARQLFSSKE